MCVCVCVCMCVPECVFILQAVVRAAHIERKLEFSRDIRHTSGGLFAERFAPIIILSMVRLAIYTRYRSDTE